MNRGSVKQGALTADGASRAVREELRRIVSSPVFEDSERLVGFLTFVVEETLAGRGNMLREPINRRRGVPPPAGLRPENRSDRARPGASFTIQAGDLV